MKGYKFIHKDMKSENGNLKWEIGKWYQEEDIEICERGLHACQEPLESLEYIYGERWFIVEAKEQETKDLYDFIISDLKEMQRFK